MIPIRKLKLNKWSKQTKDRNWDGFSLNGFNRWLSLWLNQLSVLSSSQLVGLLSVALWYSLSCQYLPFLKFRHERYKHIVRLLLSNNLNFTYQWFQTWNHLGLIFLFGHQLSAGRKVGFKFCGPKEFQLRVAKYLSDFHDVSSSTSKDQSYMLIRNTNCHRGTSFVLEYISKHSLSNGKKNESLAVLIPKGHLLSYMRQQCVVFSCW